MSRSPIASRSNEYGDRFYVWTATGVTELFWSVTTLIGMGFPKFLHLWYAKLVAELAYDELVAPRRRSRAAQLALWATRGRAYVAELQAVGLLKTIKLAKMGDREAALRYLKSQPERVRDAAGERGSAVHQNIEDLVLDAVRDAADLLRDGDPLPNWNDTIAPYMTGFANWNRAWHPRFEATEFTVFNRAAQYAGTADALIWIWLDGEERLVLVDWKTVKELRAEVGLQLAAYRRGEFMGLSNGSEKPMPEVYATFALHLFPPTEAKPEGFAFCPIRSDDEIYREFRYVLETARFRMEVANTVVGAPMAAPGVVAEPPAEETFLLTASQLRQVGAAISAIATQASVDKDIEEMRAAGVLESGSDMFGKVEA